jgi:hypothetical protein
MVRSRSLRQAIAFLFSDQFTVKEIISGLYVKGVILINKNRGGTEKPRKPRRDGLEAHDFQNNF